MTILAVVLLGSGATLELCAQGQFRWGNNFTGLVRAPIYGLDPANPPVIKRGNTAMGIPPGTQTYAGPLLEGTGFTVGIYLGSDPFSTMAAMNHIQTTTFLTGAGAGLTHAMTAADPFRPPGTANVHYQFRAWDNQGGAITSWAQLLARGGHGGSGVSEVYVFTSPLGGASVNPPGVFLPPVTLGIGSFQLTALAVPEPSAWALLAVGTVLIVVVTRNHLVR